MIELKTTLYIALIHLAYYTYFQIVSDVLRIGMVHNTPNITVDKLRTKYGVNIRTFQRNSKHYGFAWFKTMYLNENLFNMKFKRSKDPNYALKWTFHHEHYHLMKNHKLKILLMRLAFSFSPLLMAVFHWWVFFLTYVLLAYAMYFIADDFETRANKHANSIMND